MHASAARICALCTGVLCCTGISTRAAPRRAARDRALRAAHPRRDAFALLAMCDLALCAQALCALALCVRVRCACAGICTSIHRDIPRCHRHVVPPYSSTTSMRPQCAGLVEIIVVISYLASALNVPRIHFASCLLHHNESSVPGLTLSPVSHDITHSTVRLAHHTILYNYPTGTKHPHNVSSFTCSSYTPTGAHMYLMSWCLSQERLQSVPHKAERFMPDP